MAISNKRYKSRMQSSLKHVLGVLKCNQHIMQIISTQLQRKWSNHTHPVIVVIIIVEYVNLIFQITN